MEIWKNLSGIESPLELIVFIVKEVMTVKDFFDDPIFEDDLVDMEEFDLVEDDGDEELYEDYIDDHREKFRFF